MSPILYKKKNTKTTLIIDFDIAILRIKSVIGLIV